MSPTAQKTRPAVPEVDPSTNGVAEVEEFELVTNVRQLAAAPPLRKEMVDIVEWKTQSGKTARFLVSELTAGDWAEFLESGRIHKKDGSQRYDSKDEDFRLLAYTIRDPHGNRIWHKVEDARAQLSPLGRAILQLLLNAANRVNSAKDESAEGNFGETQTDS